MAADMTARTTPPKLSSTFPGMMIRSAMAYAAVNATPTIQSNCELKWKSPLLRRNARKTATA